MSDDDTQGVVIRRQRRPTGERRERSRARVPALTLLHHPDPVRVGERAVLEPLAAGKSGALSRREPLFSAPGRTVGHPLADRHLSRTPIQLLPADDGGVRIVATDWPTQLHLDGAPLGGERQLTAEETERGVVIELADRVVLLLHRLSPSPVFVDGPSELVGGSEGMHRVRREIGRVADHDVPVLLRGETGTGKELAAQALHQASHRRQGAYLSVNLGALAPSIAAAELFGWVKGAFTGAVRQRAGYFARAHGGTLFLDEVGAASEEVQAMLLRVLESGEIQRVGSDETQRVDVRLVAATDADLEAEIKRGSFREPLLHRLAGYEISIPPLRERRDDFGRLLYHFLRRELTALGEGQRLGAVGTDQPPWIPASVVARLARYDWPGNVRQLRNVARQLVISSRGAERVTISPQVERLLREAEAPPEEEVEPASDAAPPPPAAPRYRRPGEVDEAELLAALRQNRWRLKPTATQLGVSRASLYVLIDRCPRVRKASDLEGAEILASRRRHAGDLEAMTEELEVSPEGLQQRMRELGLE